MATQHQVTTEAMGPADLDHHHSLGGAEGKDPELLLTKGKLLNGCVPLSHQVAGHMYGKDKVGILQHPDGTVLKQLQPPPRGPRELDFYNLAFSEECADHHLIDLQKFLPKYFGIWSPSGSSNDLYLKLEDITHKFIKPCIMDVKIGQKSYDPYASAEKIQQQISKYPLMEEIGFLVLGMRVYHAHSNSYETKNQHYGRSLTKETLKHGISKFFHNGTSLRKDIVAHCIEKVQSILEWFENQENFHFYASSLLFVYEGYFPQTTKRLIDGTIVDKRVVLGGQFMDGELLECNNNVHVLSSMENGKTEASVEKNMSRMYLLHKNVCSKRNYSQISPGVESMDQGGIRKSNSISQEHRNGNLLSKLESVFCHVPAETKERTDVRMIDFAHVFPSDKKDAGYIYGLKNLIAVLQSILND
ncbi:inositol polyphosphate multikinase [Spea bombifrons]|uniref:inositol polyphosphate multikinase n=1 Tax=Spea bombifrons TaxID=233779 RepID=UPI00234B76BB|nr:inositol polyphosphate multikinase [Spea bombifrons]